MRNIFYGFIVCIGIFLSADIRAEAEPLVLTLDDSIRMTLETDEAIDAAKASQKAAKWTLSSARRASGIGLQWTSSGYRNGGRDYRSGNRDYTYSNSLGVMFPLYTGGRIENTIKRRSYELNAADAQVELSLQNVRYKAIAAYYDALQKENMLSVAQSAVNMGEAQLKMLTVQFEEGAVARSDLLQMQVQLAGYQQDLLRAQGALKVSMSTLKSCVGVSPKQEVTLADGFIYEPYPHDLDECTDFALRNRPDGIAAAYGVKAAKSAKDVAKSADRPTLNAVMSRNITGDGAFRQERSSNWQAGFNLTWNIFDNGATAANVQTADAEVVRREAVLKETLKTIRLQTENAYTQMRAAEERIAAAQHALRQAEKSNDLAKIRYEEGVDILLNVMDAQEKLTQARTRYYTALYEYNLYRAELVKSMGSPLWVDLTKYVAAEESGKSASLAWQEASLEKEAHEEALE